MQIKPRLLLIMFLMVMTGCRLSTPSLTFTLTPIPSATSSQPAPTITYSPPTRVVPQYQIDVVFDYNQHHLIVDQLITYQNTNGEALENLLLAVEPNLWQDCFVLSSLTVNDRVNDYILNGQRLEIPLKEILMPSTSVQISMHYELFLPEAEMFTNPDDERPRIFGWMARQTNFVNWYPFIVPYVPGQGWLLHDPWFYGEHLVYEIADYEMNLRFTDPANAPLVASSGESEPNGEWTRYRLQNGRAFVFSFSDQYLISSQLVGSVMVYSYYFPLYESAGETVLRETAHALEIYTQRFGEYPHTTLSAVAGDFADGMEYSSLFFLSRDFYKTYEGTPQGYLTIIAVHETAHQWWFELVGNDQAIEPWLDEALCTYSERIYYEAVYPELVSWWWNYRIDLYNPSGWIDTPVAETDGYEFYRRAIYLNGAKFLEDLRLRVGDEAFFTFFADYVEQYRDKRATTDDFFSLLRQYSQQDFSDLLTQYFQQPH